ncbi:MAG: DUF4123 domain-containing protein [Flavobacteriales bacterium]
MSDQKYLLVDSAKARESSIHALHHFNPEMTSLYKGTAQEEYSSIAPYLFTFSNNKDFQHLIQKSGWGKSWYIQAVAPVTFEEIQKHFRRFLIVKTEEGKQLLFRFYDPRVLRIFLPSCSAEQLKDFFGPIRYFIAEDEDPSHGIRFSVENQKLVAIRITYDEIFQSRYESEKTIQTSENPEQNAGTKQNNLPENKPINNSEGNTRNQWID